MGAATVFATNKMMWNRCTARPTWTYKHSKQQKQLQTVFYQSHLLWWYFYHLYKCWYFKIRDDYTAPSFDRFVVDIAAVSFKSRPQQLHFGNFRCVSQDIPKQDFYLVSTTIDASPMPSRALDEQWLCLASSLIQPSKSISLNAQGYGWMQKQRGVQ
eukprot:Blabericola_migrator_1__2165@NODE_1599_length_4200_cov_24_677232_g1045_i0_p2_GENE_NODE_1599_length_4200_cov_24_677232_g1045_i0NODE_1599_length_4200_cov_24_677232_g1045_i0_p2_ORF_typecomplete_len157_score24_96DUF3788/PF12663_7/0_023Nrap/PF03813_14/0_23_NODE_1599_length_4200_cov_24_677232_g1045_i0270740